MFKSKEEIIKKQTEVEYCDMMPVTRDARYQHGFESGVNVGVDQAFQSFAERIDTYEKYKILYGNDTSKIELFKKDHPEVIFDFKEHSWWNDWLFHYCFDGVK